MSGANNCNKNWRSSTPSPNFPRIASEFIPPEIQNDIAQRIVEGRLAARPGAQCFTRGDWFPQAVEDYA